LFFFLRIRAKNTICSIISVTVKLRLKPILPVAQKEQFIGQPIWEERHMVFRPAQWRINTVSAFNPSAKVMAAFKVLLLGEENIWALIFKGHS